MIDRSMEDRYFAAEVMAVYRISHGDRYFTHSLLNHKQEYQGEIYTIIDRHEASIEDPALICHWPAKKRKYLDRA